MKNKLLAISAIIVSTFSFGQTIFNENFNASTNLPIGWAQYNQDGLTPSSTFSSLMGIKGWAGLSGSQLNLTEPGNVMLSMSSYTPAGTSNDWLVTPAITIPLTGFSLQYDVMSGSTTDLESYEIYISTTGNTVADFTSPSIYNESTTPVDLTNRTINLSAYSGQTIYIAFRNNSTNKRFMIIDNVIVRTLISNDIILKNTDLNRYALINSDNTLSLTIKNDGSNTITSITADWNDGASHNSTIPVTIAAGETITIDHPTLVNYSSVVEKTITVTITEVNSTTDTTDPTLNTATEKINSVSSLAEKNVLFEEGTGTWCGFCVRGLVAMNKAYVDHPTGFIGIAVHNGDPMVVGAYNSGVNFSGYPSANVDRSVKGIDASTEEFDINYAERINLIPPAAMSATATKSGSIYSINAIATFKTQFASSNFRLAAILSEDNVVGTESGYDQHNYYSGGGYGAMGGFEDLPSVVLAADMVYPHVGRALLGSFNGQYNSVPVSISDGQVVDYTFNYTVPSTAIEANLYVTVVLIDYATKEVVNAKQYKLESVGINEKKNDISMQVYPNPATESINISFNSFNSEYEVSIIDLAGRVVNSNNYTNLSGFQTINIPVNELEKGSYIITVAGNNESFTQQVIIK